MSKRLMWVDDNAIHNGPDIEGYWLIDGGGYEATELQDIADAWEAYIECSDAWISQTSTRPDAWITLVRLLDASAEEEQR